MTRTRAPSPLPALLLAAMLAALHIARVASRYAPTTGSTAPPPEGGTAPGSNHSRNARRLDVYFGFNATKWCHYANYVAGMGCNLLGYDADDIYSSVFYRNTTMISMVGGLGGGPGHVSHCNNTGPGFKYAVKIKIFSDQETHHNLNYIDQISVTWSDGVVTRIGGCDRPGCPVCDCEWAMTRDSDKHVIDLSGERRVTSYQMAIDGYYASNFETPGHLFGYLTMDVYTPSTGQTEQQGYNSCCAGEGYKFSSALSIRSGMICAITYRAGSKVDAFGVVFFGDVPK